MPTTSWCNAVCETYEKFGIYKNKNGLNYVQTYFSIVSEYIESTRRGWDQTVCKQSLRPHTSFKPRFVPYFVQNDKLTFLNLQYVVGDHSVMLQYLSWGSGKIDSGVSTPALKTDDELYSQKDGAYVEGLSCTQSFSLSSDLSLASMSAVNAVDSVSYDYDLSKNRSFRVGLGGSEFDPSLPVQECGYVLLKDGSSAFSGFKIAATEGAIENKRNDVSIPLTGVENTIGNMGLAGVGSGTAKGTVSVNSKTKDITITNEATKEAELVIEQGKAGDIDISCADIETSALSEVAVIKKLVGEDTIRAEKKGHDAFSFHSTARLIFSTNELPVVKGERSDGFYRRLLVVNMNKKPKTVNPDLFAELFECKERIVWLAVQAVRRLYADGHFCGNENSDLAVQRLRCDSDTVEAFIYDACEETPNARTERQELFNAYQRYCWNNERTPLTKNNFFKSLRLKGVTEIVSHGCRYFKIGCTFSKKSAPKMHPNEQKCTPSNVETLSDELEI